jgi:outer membrane protein OmpA-like peptidoglycan-associated protein
MALFRSLVFASFAVVLVVSPALAAPASRGVVVVAAQFDAVAAAEQAVSDARAALRHAMASGKGLKEARAGLTAALKVLDQAKAGGASLSAPAVPGQSAAKPPAEPAPAASPKPEATDAPPLTSTGAAGQPAATAPVADAVATGNPPAIGEKLADGRIILRENGRLVVSHDEDARLAASGGRISEEDAGNGERFITVDLPDGSQVVTVRDSDGEIVRRTLKVHKGETAVLIDANPASAGEIAAGIADPKSVTPVVPKVATGQFVVDGGRATPEAIGAALAAPPVAAVDRSHTLAEIRRNARLRDRLRRVDLDTIGFDEGRATLPESEAGKLAAIGHALLTILAAKPDEIFLIEGHTDAVGSDLGNLVLTDRRAETVAEVLSRTYGVPPENLVTQGYGGQYLKVPTQAAEPQNRRITIRRITPLLHIGNGV